MREGWELKKISDVTSIVTGGTPKTGTKEYWDGGIAWITPADLGKLNIREVETTRRTITEEGLQKSSAKLFPENSVILSTRAPIGHLAINTIPMSTNQGCRGIVPKENLNTIYLFYFLKANVKLLNDLGTGTTFKELSTKALGSVKIPIPPLPEQKQIVSILDKAFAAIDQAKANIEKNIENAKELFQSKLDEVFTKSAESFVTKKFEDLCKFDKKKYFGNNLPYIGLENIESNTGKLNGSLEQKEVKSSTFSFGKHHVLYGRLRPYLNKVLLPDFDGHCSTEIFPVLTSEKLDRKYLFYWFLSPSTVRKIDATWTGARMPRANMNEVLKFEINIPSVEMQRTITSELDKLMFFAFELEKKYDKKLKILEELKKSILQKAFTGELTKQTQKSHEYTTL